MGFKLNGVSYDHTALLQGALSLLACSCILTTTAIAAGQSQPDCGTDTPCGGIIIQYPFSTIDKCSRNENFTLTCNKTSGSLAFAKFRTGDNIKIRYINLQGELRITTPVTRVCFNSSNSSAPAAALEKPMRFSPFAVSSTKNRFTVVGCDTDVKISESLSGGERFSTGCNLLCTNFTDVKNGYCTGIGCCQTAFPKDVKEYNISMSSFHNHSNVSSFNPCSYAFVVEDGKFDFSTLDLKDLRKKTEFPMILNWAIERTTCAEAKKNRGYACTKNSVCVDSENGIGYLCRCRDGYQGNPYLDGSNGCKKIGGGNNVALPLASVAALLGLAVLSHSFKWLPKPNPIKVLSSDLFQQNGGELLQDLISQQGAGSQAPTIFPVDDIWTFTNGFDPSRIIGRGMGIVYKAILPGNKTVAVKRSGRRGGPRQVNSFIRELLALSQIDHENVAQFLGCCLDTEFPMLIYEFVKSVHPLVNAINPAKKENENKAYLTWEERLKIAAETADAISCLHSDASVPIVHGNIKSSNILLDKDHRAKLTDCGAWRLIPLEEDETQVSPFVKASSGYLDPEFIHTGQLNEKSDVYSFGVVVIELLTGKEAIEFSRAQQETTLVMHFLSAMNKNRLMGVIDKRIMNQRNEKELRQVASLARRCVTLVGEERPPMKDVATELKSLITVDENNPPAGDDENERAVAPPNEAVSGIYGTIRSLTGDDIEEDGEGEDMV